MKDKGNGKQISTSECRQKKDKAKQACYTSQPKTPPARTKKTTFVDMMSGQLIHIAEPGTEEVMSVGIVQQDV